MSTNAKETTHSTMLKRKGPVIEGHINPGRSTPASNPLAGIIANAAENQRKRDEEKKRREREAKEARARFALD